MKRVFSLVLLSTIVACVMMFSGCSIFETEHTHEFGEWKTVKEASCTEDGVKTRSCGCGESEEEKLTATGHSEEIVYGKAATCTEKGISDGKKCKACGIITVEQQEISLLGHNYKYSEKNNENGEIVTIAACQRDNCQVRTESLSGLYDENGKLLASWADMVNVYKLDVDDGTMSNLIEFYEGLIKHEIISKVSKLILDESITNIDFINFMPLKNLTEIAIPSSATSIINTSWGSCTNIVNIIVDENNDYYKSVDGNLYSKDGTTFIQYAGGKRDSEFIIPSHVTNIGQCAFSYSNCLKSIVIPSSVTKIEAGVFYYCELLRDIYFEGTEEQWITLNYTRRYMPDSIFIHYDGKVEVMSAHFINYSGASSSPRLMIVIEDEKVYIGSRDPVDFYDKIYFTENLKFDNANYILLSLQNIGETEKVSIMEKLFENEKWYILETILSDNTINRIAICQIEDFYYFVTLKISKSNETIEVSKIHRLKNW